ncbi:MAG: twin-arginine translocation signal domain-containing protein, partial [Pseudomonadota bacterium]
MADKTNTGRRDFLKLATTAAPAAAVAVAAGQADAGPAEPDLTSDKMQDTAKTGLRTERCRGKRAYGPCP